MIIRVKFVSRTKKLLLRERALEMPGDSTQNTGVHGLMKEKITTRISCFDHVTTATNPLPNR